jgi:hypothetical protein
MSKIRLHGTSSGYTEIAPVAASGNNTLTLPNDGTIISHDSAGAIGITSVRATNAHFSGTTRVTTGITTTATITTAKVTTIQDASGGNSSTPEQIEQGRAKAWINFNGTGTIAIQDSFNVSSITDDGTGLYTITYSSAFSNTNYCILTGQASKNTDDTDNRYISRCLDRSTSNMQVSHDFIENGTSNRTDSNFMYFAVLA